MLAYYSYGGGGNFCGTGWRKLSLYVYTVALASISKNIIFKIHFKKPTLPWYWTRSVSIIILSYLLAFVQLTWQVDNGWFLPVFDNYFMEFINIAWASVYKGWVRGWVGWVVLKLEQRSKMTQIVEFRVVMTYTCTHKGSIFHYKVYTDMHWQCEQYQVSTAKPEPSFGTISPIVDLHGRQKALLKSRPVNISQWRQWICIVI